MLGHQTKHHFAVYPGQGVTCQNVLKTAYSSPHTVMNEKVNNRRSFFLGTSLTL
jgi:hypothetical protein